MKVAVTGAKGQLGTEIVQYLSKHGFEVVGFGKEELNITDLEEVFNKFTQGRYSVVIHCAAYTKVDQAENEPNESYRVNAIGSRNIAIATEKIRAKLVYISTDYVFDGTKTMALDEFEPTTPINVYGRSKLAGEHFVQQFHTKYFIVRTSWVYGPHGHNFVYAMSNKAKAHKAVSVVCDQIGSPTYTLDLAETITRLIETEKYGIYHVSNSGSCSWFEFALEIFKHIKPEMEVMPVSSAEYESKARRPAYSVLEHRALEINSFPPMRHWRSALNSFFERNKDTEV